MPCGLPTKSRGRPRSPEEWIVMSNILDRAIEKASGIISRAFFNRFSPADEFHTQVSSPYDRVYQRHDWEIDT